MSSSTYIATNSKLNLYGPDGKLQLGMDALAAKEFFQQHVNPSTRAFRNTAEKFRYLEDEGLYESDVLSQYSREDIIALSDYAFSLEHRFTSFMGARKFYAQYALTDQKSNSELDGPTYLERFEDRVVMTALTLARGDIDLAKGFVDEMISGRYQPATPTFLNAGRVARGEAVSCFPAGTPVTTEAGLSKNIEDIVVGDLVMTHKGRLRPVTKVIENRSDDGFDMVTLKAAHLPSVTETVNHPVLVWNENPQDDRITEPKLIPYIPDHQPNDVGHWVWVAAANVRPMEDWVFAPSDTTPSRKVTIDMSQYIQEETRNGTGGNPSRLNDNPWVVCEDGFIRYSLSPKTRTKTHKYALNRNAVKRHIEVDYDFGVLAGYYLAEGCTYKNSGSKVPNMVSFTFGSHENFFIEDCARLIQQKFGFSPTVRKNKDGSTVINASSRMVADFFLETFGTGFDKKTISKEMFYANEDFLYGLLIGITRGDGHVSHDSAIVTMTNPRLVRQLFNAFMREGMSPSFRLSPSQSGKINGNVSVRSTSGPNEDFILNTEKSLHRYLGPRRPRGHEYMRKTDHGVLYKVVSVESAAKESVVYNLKVQEDHTYLTEGFVQRNCFLLRIEDNMESISRGHNAALQLSKRGGGVALLLSNLREQGSPIKGIQNASSGVVPVMKMLEDAFSYANQLGARQGAGAVYLNVHHPDILRFLDTKRENADEKVRIKTLSLGVVIPDITFELAKKNEAMYLFSPYDVERVYGKPFADINVSDLYYEMIDDDRIRKYKISARELFSTIAEIQFESGYPYIMYEDTVNKANPAPGSGKITHSNLCVTGDTEILTDSGYRKVRDLYESQEDFDVIVDKRARDMDLENMGTSVEKSTKMFKTAEDADVFKVSTAEGFEITATEWHKFYVDRDGELVKIPLAEVEVGDRLLVQSGENNSWGDVHQPDLAYLAGVIAADGTFVKQTNESVRIDLYGDKDQFAPGIRDAVHRVLKGREDLVERQATITPEFNDRALPTPKLMLQSAPLAKALAEHGFTSATKLSVPEFVKRGDRETQRAYINGVWQMDGCITGSAKYNVRSVELGSTNIEFLRDMQRLLLGFGIYTRTYVSRKETGTAQLPDGKGGYAEYVQQASWTLRVNDKAGVYALVDLVQWREASLLKWGEVKGDEVVRKSPRHKYRATVVSIEFAGIEDVYDVTVDNGNSVIFNGIATGNCSEVLQGSTPSTYHDDLSYDVVGQDISCNLGSLNIAKAMESPDFAKTVDLAMRSLTAVSDITSIESVPSIKKANDSGHSVGLGQMNLHGFLAKERIHYDSPEAVDFTDVYFALVNYYTLVSSNRIAKETGERFSDFEESTYADGSYFDKYVEKNYHPKTERVRSLFEKYGIELPDTQDWARLRDEVQKTGLYHRYRQAVPPTGSISYVNHSTSSIHPIVAKIEVRKEGKVGRVYYPAPYLSDDNMEYYRDAFEIGPEALIDVYAAATEHVDQGLSCTLFFPDTVNTRDVNKAQIYAWRKGIKTIYYIRIRQAALAGTEAEGCVSCTL